jgi:hypothetical protein
MMEDPNYRFSVVSKEILDSRIRPSHGCRNIRIRLPDATQNAEDSQLSGSFEADQ